MEEYVKKTAGDWDDIMSGPRLDNLPSHMVDSGEKLVRRTDSASIAGSEAEGGSPRGAHPSSRKFFQIGKRKPKGPLNEKSVSCCNL